MQRCMPRGAGLLLAASGGLCGCNLLIGLDEVNIVQSSGVGGDDTTSATSGGGAAGETGAGGHGAGSSSSASGSGGTTTSASSGGGGSGGCAQDGDCTAPLVCDEAVGTCVAPSCDDGSKDGAETGPDCGGPDCGACADGLGCEHPGDCQSGVCNGTCQVATCPDGVQNGGETDLDCGGTCAIKCGAFEHCKVDGDCESKICDGNGAQKKCAPAACDDGIVNGAEQCDDGNGLPGDGCSAACSLEPGYACSGEPSVCAPVCGDGMLKGGEQCDDGNALAGDGCGALCRVEVLFQCTTPGPSACTKQETRCADGMDSDGDTFTDGTDVDCALPGYFPWPPCAGYRVYRSVNAPKNIPDDAGSAWSQILVPDEGTVAHFALVLDISHPRISDVDVTLIPPSGTPRDITSGNGGLGSNYASTVFDSMCPMSVAWSMAPFSDCLEPESLLPSGGQVNGSWMLRVSDHAAGQVGSLDAWTLVVCLQ